MDTLRAGPQDYVVWDRDLPGFGVRVQASGRKVFLVQGRGPHGSKRMSIGSHGELSVVEARKQAIVLMRGIKRGEDPGINRLPPRRRWPTSPDATCARMWRSIASPGPWNCIEPSSTAILFRRWVRGRSARCGAAMSRHCITRFMIAPPWANSTIQVLSQLLRKAQQWGLAPQRRNPCRSVRKYRLRLRNRHLTRDEYRRLGQALRDGEADGSVARPAATALRLLILTGCRRDEILTLRWDDVDRHSRELRLRDSKSGPCMVALTQAAEGVVDGIRRTPGNPWVIAGEAPGSRLMTLKSTLAEGEATRRAARCASPRPAPLLCHPRTGVGRKPDDDRQAPESRPDAVHGTLRTRHGRRRKGRCGAGRRQHRRARRRTCRGVEVATAAGAARAMTDFEYRRLNNRTVDALEVQRETLFWDRHLPGFAVRVYPSGTRTYVVQTRGPVWRQTGHAGPARGDHRHRGQAPRLAGDRADQVGEGPVAGTLRVQTSRGSPAGGHGRKVHGRVRGGALQAGHGADPQLGDLQTYRAAPRQAADRVGQPPARHGPATASGRNAGAGEQRGHHAVADLYQGTGLGDRGRGDESLQAR